MGAGYGGNRHNDQEAGCDLLLFHCVFLHSGRQEYAAYTDEGVTIDGTMFRRLLHGRIFAVTAGFYSIS